MAITKKNNKKNVITLNIKGSSIEVQTKRPLLEDGQYVARIEDIELKWDKRNESQYLHVSYGVDQGEGKPMFPFKDRIYFSEGNEQRLNEFLTEVCQGNQNGTLDENDLIGQLGVIEVVTRTNGQDNPYNTVLAWDFSGVEDEEEIAFDEEDDE